MNPFLVVILVAVAAISALFAGRRRKR